jgi:adenosylcobinamide-GDP ribazoletransferase
MTMDADPPPRGNPAASEITVVADEIRQSAALLTRLPAGAMGVDPARKPDFTHAARVFPVVGALVGLAGGLVLVVAMGLGVPPLVACGLAVAATVVLTGGLHEDGLADVADAFGGATAAERLDILKDSRVGAFGASALVFSILLRVAALAAIAGSGAIRAALALVVAESVSRAALVRLWHDLPAARAGGLSSEAGPPDQNAMLVALAVAAVVAVLLGVPSLGLWATVLAAALAAIATFGMVRLAARLFGGRTGDTLGACQQVVAVAFLVGASVA